MKKIQFVLTFILLVASSQAALSQEDSPWWRKLFKKETVEEMEKDTPDYTKPEPEVPVEKETVPEVKEVDSIPNTPAVLNRPGVITMNTPVEMARLDSSYRSNPPALDGFRIQIYFGELEKARAMRTGFLNSSKSQPCYLEQNPPNFAVQVGDFRTQLEAFKALEEVKSNYPNALVVPAKIELPKL